ncbi:MAG: hypothetical protein JRM77_01790 [Nitrososphaerota archaeon]|nr:hypothetical protein [Nitrososphaerota archaeon]
MGGYEPFLKLLETAPLLRILKTVPTATITLLRIIICVTAFKDESAWRAVVYCDDGACR